MAWCLQLEQGSKSHGYVFFFLRTEYKVRIVLRAKRSQTALDWTNNEIVGKNYKNSVHKIFKWRINIWPKFQQNSHVKSMAFFSTCYSMQPRLAAFTCFVNAKKGTVRKFLVEKFNREKKTSRRLDGHIFLSRLCVTNMKTVSKSTAFSR